MRPRARRLPRPAPPAPVALVVAAVVVVALIAVAGLALRRPSSAEKHPAAAAVERVLRMRDAQIADPKAYASYFLRSQVATELAQSAEEATAGQRLIPRWKAPYVAEEGTSTVSVVVVWRRDPALTAFPKATVFVTRQERGRWIIIDAREVSKDQPVPPPLADGRG